jgi:hypothetical protein
MPEEEEEENKEDLFNGDAEEDYEDDNRSY